MPRKQTRIVSDSKDSTSEDLKDQNQPEETLEVSYILPGDLSSENIYVHFVYEK